MSRALFQVALVILVIAAITTADESLQDIACRSVHLSFNAPPGIAFYNEVTVERSASGTYFMRSTPLTWLKFVGLELADPPARSAMRTVPLAVPSDFQSS